MCLWVDPLKDAVGSSFGKADRLCLYLHDQKLCRVEENQHQLAHQCSPNNWDIWEWGICQKLKLHTAVKGKPKIIFKDLKTSFMLY